MDSVYEYLRMFNSVIGTGILLFLVKTLWTVMNFRMKDPNSKAPLPPGSMGWPFFGETIPYLIKGSEYFEERFRKYGCVISTHLFGMRTIRVRGAENLRKILYSEEEYVQLKYPTSTLKLFGKNTITSTFGSQHAHLRKCMSSVFTQDALEGYVDLIQEPLSEGIKSWCNQESVLAHFGLRKLLFQIMGKVLCGFETNGEEAESLNKHFDNFLNGTLSIPINLPGTQFRKALQAKKVLCDAIESKIRAKENIPSSEDVVDALRILMDQPLADGSLPSHEEVKTIAFDLLFLSFAATSSASTGLLQRLIENPDVVTKIREELYENGLLHPEAALSWKKINACSYVNRVVFESLRWQAPIPGSFREVLKTFELDGKQIPKGWKILWSIRDTMKFSDSYTNREEFDPDRFLPERSEHKTGGRYNFPVFGGGSRACPGQPLAKLILRIEVIELVRRCNFKMLRPETLKIRSMPCPYPTNGLPVRFTSISENISSVHEAYSKLSNNTDPLQKPVSVKG